MCFTAPSWEYVLVLVMGAVLAPGKRTVSACLRMTGRAGAKNFSSYHQLLNRARWNPHVMARHLLGMVVNRLVPEGPVVIGMDDMNQTGFTGGHKAWKISHDQRKFRKPFFDRSAGARSAFGA